MHIRIWKFPFDFRRLAGKEKENEKDEFNKQNQKTMQKREREKEREVSLHRCVRRVLYVKYT